MALGDLTKDAVQLAIQEYDQLGANAFLSKYGFTDAKLYWITYNGKQYPSKAVAGVAHRFIDGNQLLPSSSFTGGKDSVVRKLRQLGFVIDIPERNPPWSRDELILALDLYYTNSSNPPGKGSSSVADLSALLNKMHRLNGVSASPTLRNENGVYLKMMNLRALDPAFTAQGKVGMQSGGKLEKVVWADYKGRRDDLAADATEIRQTVIAANEAVVAKLPIADAYEGTEGGLVMRLHKRYERDPKLVAEKRKAAAAAGKLVCEVCSFDFEKVYGELGAGYIEVHHTKPVHTLIVGSKTKLDDLALLCANCHRMAHRSRYTLSIENVSKAYNKNEVL